MVREFCRHRLLPVNQKKKGEVNNLTCFNVDNRKGGRKFMWMDYILFCCVDNHLLVQDLYSMLPEG